MSSVEQDHDAGELDPAEEISGELVVACGDGAEMCEFVEEALDEIALAIEREVATARRLPVGFRRNHRGNVAPRTGTGGMPLRRNSGVGGPLPDWRNCL